MALKSDSIWFQYGFDMITVEPLANRRFGWFWPDGTRADGGQSFRTPAAAKAQLKRVMKEVEREENGIA